MEDEIYDEYFKNDTEESWEAFFEGRLQAITQTDWEQGSTYTKEQHETIRNALTLMRELRAMSDEQLTFFYEEEHDKPAPSRQEDDRWKFFNRAKAQANFGFWTRVDAWSLEEAVALCLGRNPDLVNSKTLRGLLTKSPFAQRFAELLKLAHRSQEAGTLKDPIPPVTFLEWAEQKGIECRALRDALVAHATEIVDWKGRYEEARVQIEDLENELRQLRAPIDEETRPVHAKTRQTFFKIIYLLAAKDEAIPASRIEQIKRTIVSKAPMFGLTADDEAVGPAVRDAVAYVDSLRKQKS